MKPLTAEWVEVAEGDFIMLQREMRARKSRVYAGACFLAQQCVEKYLKACLCEAGKKFPKTHDLVTLMELAHSIEPSWELLRDAFGRLTDFAVAVRYPGTPADASKAKEANKLFKQFRGMARRSLGMRD